MTSSEQPGAPDWCRVHTRSSALGRRCSRSCYAGRMALPHRTPIFRGKTSLRRCNSPLKTHFFLLYFGAIALGSRSRNESALGGSDENAVAVALNFSKEIVDGNQEGQEGG